VWTGREEGRKKRKEGGKEKEGRGRKIDR
jgi:hypothetical protein